MKWEGALRKLFCAALLMCIVASFPSNEQGSSALKILFDSCSSLLWIQVISNEISASNHSEKRFLFSCNQSDDSEVKNHSFFISFVDYRFQQICVTNLFCGSRENRQVVVQRVTTFIDHSRTIVTSLLLVILLLCNFTEIKQAWKNDGIHRSFVKQRCNSIAHSFLPSFQM